MPNNYALDPEIKAEWVRRLRSGDYIQGHGTLKRRVLDEDGQAVRVAHCCLGVLCEIAAEKGVVEEDRLGPGDYEFDGEGGVLPAKVARWAGFGHITSPTLQNENWEPGDTPPFPELVGTSFENNSYAYLTELNDCGQTFTTIADLIERYL